VNHIVFTPFVSTSPTPPGAVPGIARTVRFEAVTVFNSAVFVTTSDFTPTSTAAKIGAEES
jgi:hypothetical protein